MQQSDVAACPRPCRQHPCHRRRASLRSGSGKLFVQSSGKISGLNADPSYGRRVRESTNGDHALAGRDCPETERDTAKSLSAKSNQSHKPQPGWWLPVRFRTSKALHGHFQALPLDRGLLMSLVIKRLHFVLDWSQPCCQSASRLPTLPTVSLWQPPVPRETVLLKSIPW